MRSVADQVVRVTHDLLDVLALADRLVVLDGGEVVESGATAHLLAHPRSEFLARFLGVNVVHGWLRDENLTVDREHTIRGLRSADDDLFAAVDRRGQGREGWATFSPEAPTIHLPGSSINGSSARNNFPARIDAVESRGPVSRVWCVLAGQRLAVDVTAASITEMHLEPGQKILLSIKAPAVTLY